MVSPHWVAMRTGLSLYPPVLNQPIETLRSSPDSANPLGQGPFRLLELCQLPESQRHRRMSFGEDWKSSGALFRLASERQAVVVATLIVVCVQPVEALKIGRNFAGVFHLI